MVGIAAEVCTDGSVPGSVRGIWYRTEVNLQFGHSVHTEVPYRALWCMYGMYREPRCMFLGTSVLPLYFVFPNVLWSAYPVASKSGVVGIRYK